MPIPLENARTAITAAMAELSKALSTESNPIKRYNLAWVRTTLAAFKMMASPESSSTMFDHLHDERNFKTVLDGLVSGAIDRVRYEQETNDVLTDEGAERLAEYSRNNQDRIFTAPPSPAPSREDEDSYRCT